MIVILRKQNLIGKKLKRKDYRLKRKKQNKQNGLKNKEEKLKLKRFE
jgi:hypothetical protein